MDTFVTRSFLILGVLLTSLGLSATEIPTQLLNTPDNDGLNAVPYCGRCRTDLKAQPDGSATLEIDYDDDYGDLHGTIELTILRYNGGARFETIDADLESGQSALFELEADEGWTWADVELVLVELVPG
jgi:hypothetical protein